MYDMMYVYVHRKMNIFLVCDRNVEIDNPDFQSGSPCLISLTFSGEILVHSLPSLRPVATIPYKPLHDLRYVHTYVHPKCLSSLVCGHLRLQTLFVAFMYINF